MSATEHDPMTDSHDLDCDLARGDDKYASCICVYLEDAYLAGLDAAYYAAEGADLANGGPTPTGTAVLKRITEIRNSTRTERTVR